MDYSPAMSVTSEMTDEELDQYLATYVPLSNLPTPPPAREHAIAATPRKVSTMQASSLDQPAPSPELEVYATHLANSVPSNVSTHRPHGHVIYGFLERAHLPDEVVAFAACVLDSLSLRFATTWREMLVPAEFERDLRNFLRNDGRRSSRVNPDLIVLAALSLAHGHLVDQLRSSRHWSVKESDGMFTVQEIEATKRAILADTNYGLARIQHDMVQRMLRDMQRPRTSPATTPLARHSSVSKQERRRTFSLNLSGAAIWTHGVQTPEPSP